MEERLDKLLIQLNLVDTRAHAEKIIREVGVKVNGKLITKAGKRFPVDCKIELLTKDLPWVSNAAVKLLEALKSWEIDLSGKSFIDIGASKGGFAEVLLKNNASKVYCVDVELGKLHPSIESDERVINIEKTQARELTPKIITGKVDGCVIHDSNNSPTKIFPFIHAFIEPGGSVIALIRPQLEVEKQNIGKGGIVKDAKLFPEMIEKIKLQAVTNNLVYQDHISSPILGSDGNREFLMLFSKEK
jgi:23S rRNA (cytidine1920-2'-O)/16S rRNA (cytidine1409-2'-O)-methyltransferase